ncbi:hypothetical protein HFZ78_13455 [Priestia megaterium]|uniref:Mannitol repressor n=1 Tax=Priestia megaterium TaxID=1404 RepID=A0A6H1P1Z4_PRIMG|nr:hypothetical protein [Priestia megaterium]QIZ07614.1 hypothetical protein HFZ78_13455 [Priestia megaterium]
MELTKEFLEQHSKNCEKDAKESINKFLLETASYDLLQVVLRGHLYIERELTILIKKKLIEPDEYLKNMMFGQKLSLAFALGCVSKEERSTYAKLNELRNGFAHNLEYELTEEVFMNLVNTVGSNLSSLKARYDLFVSKKTDSDLLSKFRYLICLLWVHIKLKVLVFEIDQFIIKTEEAQEIFGQLIKKISSEDI